MEQNKNNHHTSSTPASATCTPGRGGFISPESFDPILIPVPQTPTALKDEVSKLHLADDGDYYERQYWPIIKERFPYYEQFWRFIAVPLTRRLERERGDPARIERREGIADDVWTVTYLNYSLFLHLTAAFDHLPVPLGSSFSNFYTHLGSACDLAEDFLLQAYIIICECSGKTVPVLQNLSKDEFLALAARWYDKRYSRLYENYHSKGKGSPLYLPARAEILADYFTSNRQAIWKAYKSFAGTIRPYRNRFVHDVAIGNVLVGKIRMVPRKERIQDYRSMEQVIAATRSAERLKEDFVVREEQMFNDWQELQKHLNALWKIPIRNFYELLYEKMNPTMMKKYNLQFT